MPPLDRQSDDLDVPKIVTSVPELLCSLSEAFQLRHILAHEAAPNLHIDHDQALRLLQTVDTWIDAVDGILWMTTWKDVPLTQLEMNMAAAPTIRASRANLAHALTRLRGSLGTKGRRSLSKNHFDWRRMSSDFIDISYGNRRGTMWRAIVANLWAELLEERVKHMATWADTEELER